MAPFYILNRDVAPTGFRQIELDGDVEQVPPARCPKCGEELALSADAPGARYRLSGRGELGDMLTDGIAIAVSKRFADLYKASGLTGLTIRSQPMTIAPSCGAFFYAIPQATCVLLDENASGVVVDKLTGCTYCRVMSIAKIDRAVFREETWQGEDIFACGNLFSEIITTQRFKDFVENHELQNFGFIPGDAFSYDYRRP